MLTKVDVNDILRRSLPNMVMVAIPGLVYVLSLTVTIPTQLGLSFRYDPLVALVAMMPILVITFQIPGRIGIALSFSATMLFFALPLAGAWQSGVSEAALLIGGLLPWADAGSYYGASQQILTGFPISLGTLRPWFPGTFAVLLGLTQHNFQMSLAILNAIVATSCYLTGQALKITHGAVASAGIITITFLFARIHLGKPLTENLGLSLGLLGCTLLWQGVHNRWIRECLLGIFVLTVALNARAGAFFILPILVIFGTLLFRESRKISWRFLLIGSGSVLAGFVLNSILKKLVGPFGIQSIGHFSYVLYGLLTGGNWTQVRIDYPEIMELSETERINRTSELALNLLQEEPSRLIRGSLRAWNAFILSPDISRGRTFIFTFIDHNTLESIVGTLALIGLLGCLIQFRKPIYTLILVANLGILASIPFIPPWDGHYRVHASTLFFSIIFPILGLSFLIGILKTLVTKTLYSRKTWTDSDRPYRMPNSETLSFLKPTLTQATAYLSLGIISVGFLGTIGIYLIANHTQNFPEVTCPPDETVEYVRYSEGSYLNLVDDQHQTRVPNIRVTDFKQGLNVETFGGYSFSSVYPEDAEGFTTLKAGQVLTTTTNLEYGAYSRWLVMEARDVPERNGIVGMCGKWDEQIKWLRFFHVSSVITLSDL